MMEDDAHMTASLGIWAHFAAPDGVTYRWAADEGRDGTGFLHFDPAANVFRPSDGAHTIGDLRIDGGTGDVTGSADGVDVRILVKVATAILRAYAKSGDVPETAHAYFY